MPKRNFLLAKGERLTKGIIVRPGFSTKLAPYTFGEAKRRLHPMLEELSDSINALPEDACPDDLAVATITLNPEYIAKSYFPAHLLRAIGLDTIGSRARIIKPEKRSADRIPEETVTTELFVIGKRPSFQRWANEFQNWSERTPGAEEIVQIERITLPKPENKIKKITSKNDSILFEVVLHLEEAESRYLVDFRKYLQKFHIKPKFDKRLYAGGLCFIELEAPKKLAEEIAQFSLVRVVRAMPSLRLLRPPVRTGKLKNIEKVALPKASPLDKDIKVAVFDGGIPPDHPITHWARPFETAGLGGTDPELLEHGVGVTSALLFGHIDPKKPISRPYSYVDHYRVLDSIPGNNPYELYEVLNRINDVLKTKRYDFISLSLGPELPIEDDEVHAWTALLDDYLSTGSTLATIAVGNGGEGDAINRLNRVQVPADCVNALGVGACDVPDDNWQRASYSSIGPGRSPGLVKPDLVDFGGSLGRMFITLDATDGNKLFQTAGTSFAAPSTLRQGIGVRAHFGSSLGALAIRTLLVHCAESADISKFEIGFGRVARELEDIVVCDDHTVRVVYQGKITASKFIRAQIPLPRGKLKGMVKIKATLCYATKVDPNHPSNYTRSGLIPVFRPDKDVYVEDEENDTISQHPKTKAFFAKAQKAFQTEEELRRDAWKWENCLHGECNFRPTSLNGPVFDIHYNARQEGRNARSSHEIEYVLVITVSAPKVADFYNQVVREYATVLEALQPVIDIPIRIS
jgi:hypothetical protein